MAGRAKWEDMVNSLKETFTPSNDKEQRKQSAKEATGSGAARQAAEQVGGREAQIRQALKDAGAD